jgi:hypothetical protein
MVTSKSYVPGAERRTFTSTTSASPAWAAGAPMQASASAAMVIADRMPAFPFLIN